MRLLPFNLYCHLVVELVKTNFPSLCACSFVTSGRSLSIDRREEDVNIDHRRTGSGLFYLIEEDTVKLRVVSGVSAG